MFLMGLNQFFVEPRLQEGEYGFYGFNPFENNVQ